MLADPMVPPAADELVPPPLLLVLLLLPPPPHAASASAAAPTPSTPGMDLEIRMCCLSLLLGFTGASTVRARVEGILQPIADQVERKDGENEGDAGEDHVPPRRVED